MTREVKYNGLRKRDTYEEIIDLLQSGESDRIQYPNRIASQIMNSPYMKQIDGFSFLDLQQQQERQQKEILKQMMMKKISEQTGIHYTTTQHLLDREKRDGIAEQVKQDLTDASEFGSAMEKSFDTDVKEGLDIQAKHKQLRLDAVSRFTTEHLQAAHGSPAKLAEMAVNIGQVSPQRPADPDKMVVESGLENEIARKAREEALLNVREQYKERESQAKKIQKEQHEQEHQDALSEAVSSLQQQASELYQISGSHASQQHTPASSRKSSSGRVESAPATPAQSSGAQVYTIPPRRIPPRPENYHIASPERSEGYGISPIPPKSSSGPTPASSGSRARSVPPHNHTPSSAHTPSHSPGQSLDQSSRRTPASAHTPSGSPPPSQTQSSRSRSKSRTPASAQTPSGSPPSSVRAKSKSQASTPSSKYYGTPSGGRYVYKK